MRVVDFFSGIGGFSLGLENVGFRTVAFSEIDPYACAVLKKHWPDVPNLGDIRTLEPGAIPDADLWCGGFPCQDISVANANATGLEGERSGLWWELARLITVCRPQWVVLENVPAVLWWQFGDILRFFSEERYLCEWEVLSAKAFGALHRRERVWIVAHAYGAQGREQGCGSSMAQAGNREDKSNCDEPGRMVSTSSDSIGSGRQWGGEADSTRRKVWDDFKRLLQLESQLAVPAGSHGRVSDGLPHRLHRLRCLGNSIYPPIAAWIGERMNEVR